MRWRSLAGILTLGLLLCPATLVAQDVRTFESLTVATSAVGITSTVIQPTGQLPVQACAARLETAQIRFRVDGTAPTASEGRILDVGDVLEIAAPADIRFIRTGGTSGTLKIDCWRGPRPTQVLSLGTQNLAAGTNNIGDVDVLSVIPGTGATNLGKAEDGAHADGDTGIATLGVRKDSATQTTSADGDHADFAVDAYSAQFTRQDHPNRIRCTVTVSTATTIQAVGGSCAAPGAGLSIYLTDISFSTNAGGIAADSFNTLKYGTGGTCGTGTTVFWGAMNTAAAQTTIFESFNTPIKIPANNEVCWINTTAGSKFLVLTGFIAP